jgi:phage terminase small subunit
MPPFNEKFWRAEMPNSKASALPKPPAHLRRNTAKWFKSVVDEYDLDPHHIRLLTLAAEAWDRGQQAREIIEVEGLTFTDRFDSPKPRPEVAIERDSRIGFARLIRELALDGVDAPDAPRSPRTSDYGNRR